MYANPDRQGVEALASAHRCRCFIASPGSHLCRHTRRRGTGAGGPQAAAIQSVIEKANQEQAQALATGDPSVMSDTATAAYLRQLLQIQQRLIAQGATRIDLTQLTWGSIQVNGGTASATTSETWITTFSDGTTFESTNINAYTLINQGGAWLIAADNQTTPSAPQTMPSSPQAPVPMVPMGTNTSRNWAGYAATNGQYTGVTATWTVPQPNAIGGGAVGATWVGIGGVTTRDLIQAGTQDATPAAGQAEFHAWIEMLPQPSQQVPLAVAPGDSVTVSVDEQAPGTGTWQISIANNTSGQSFQTTVSYASTESPLNGLRRLRRGRAGSCR